MIGANMTHKQLGFRVLGILMMLGLSACEDTSAPTITSIQNDNLNPSEGLVNGGVTTDVAPYITGSAVASISKDHDVQVYVDDKLWSYTDIINNGTQWVAGGIRSPLSVGTHKIQAVYVEHSTAKVGTKSSAWTLTIKDPIPEVGLPHTGVTKCYSSGSNTLSDCITTSIFLFSNTQDGWRQVVNPRSYSSVGNKTGGTYDKTECVKDNVTGLMWEGKTNSGTRAGSNFYYNIDDTSTHQLSNDTSPTDKDIASSTNSVGYVNAVNNLKLCGFSDWRRPTAQELETLADLSTSGIDTTWFPNTNFARPYWTRTPNAVDAKTAWAVFFNAGAGGGVSTYTRSASNLPVRLVRSGQNQNLIVKK
jgi:hypothetical protein